ncbi:hypothetical protein GCM10011608_10110 [Micromonospora sonchi]|uniref:Uncharacterized protein n=1 Tax=Micromonospora sonchi TaxID=1763543 RepID=A0A917TLP1_9ACTN|nr:hypothetical protein [Micromonospora sonchi]GGM27325.1 hypothetical protein GCM10011608_10110 [Micromonospora sonchi]
MTRLEQLRHYTRTYYAAATQLRTSRAAREWMESGQPAEVAAQWANIGCLPAEALPLIASGMTPEMVLATDPTTDAERMQRLTDRMQMLD